MLGGGDVRFFRSMGVLTDLTPNAKKMGFDPGQTYPAAEVEIAVDGRQFAFPCNVSTHGYWINKDVFAKAGVCSPPYRWTLDEFEAIGKELCNKANAGLARRQVFFCSQIEYLTFARSLGLDRFNETMTRCTLDDPRFSEVLARVYRWTFVDNILPTPEDADSLPPNPIYTNTEAFQHPPKYPNEWEVHEPFARMAETIAIESSYSPFVSDRTCIRIQEEVIGSLMAKLVTAEEAAETLARRVNVEIERNVSASPPLQKLYEQKLSDQARIDEFRAKGEPVPTELIANPFYRAYYAQKRRLTVGVTQ